MKFSFSTRGWEGLGQTAALEMATEMKYSGVEFYNYQDTKEKALSLRQLKNSRLEVPCFDTSFEIAEDGLDFKKFTELAEIARSLHVPSIAVVANAEEPEIIKKNVEKLIAIAKEKGIIVLIKTKGVFSDTAKLREMLDFFAADELGALWDMHYPFRVNDESASKTIKNLGAYVYHVHLRDSKSLEEFCFVGEGDMPIDEMFRALSSINYDGYISLEWKAEWMPEMQEFDVVLAYFINYMNKFDDPASKKRDLFWNHDGSGQYVWKKNDLIDLTFPQVLDRMVEEFPNQYAFKYTTLDYTRTYEQFRDDVDNFARALVSMGVKAGSKVAIWATNVPAWYITFWAATKIGAVLVTVNTAYKSHEAEYLFRQSDTHTLVMIESALDANYREIINELCPEIAETAAGEPLHCKKLPFLRNVITVGFEQPGCLTFEQAMKRADLVSLETIKRMAAQVKPGDVCNMQYTSGTTGFPKGVMLTHYNVVNNGKCIGDRMGLSTADRMMIQVPMFHCFGMVLSMTSSMTHGATLCPMPYFSARASLACINLEKITCFNGVPTMFIAMINHPDYKKTDFSHIRTGIMAGAGCPPELMRRVSRPDEMNMQGIISVYGQTETSPGCVMSAWTDTEYVRTDTVGYAFPHVECKVIDPETGETLGPNQDGEFCSRGYNTMKGYYKMPYETSKAIDADGWLHSGDIARFDEDGNCCVTGRIKDMIIRGGENLYPKEIEEFIYTHPMVKDVQVIGIPDEKYGEEAMACIILNKEGAVTVEEMHDYIKASLARHKVPRYIEFVNEFPMNAAGKVLKYKMREEFAKKLGKGK